MGTMRKAVGCYGVFILLCIISIRAEESTTPLASANILTDDEVKEGILVPDDTVLHISDQNIEKHASLGSNVSRAYEDDLVPSTPEGRMAYLLDDNGVSAKVDYFFNLVDTVTAMSRSLNTSFFRAGVRKGLFDDLIVTEEQRSALFGRNESSTRSKRTATLPTIMPWPNGIIKYDFKYGDFFDFETREMRAAMDVWQHHTCIKFQLVSRRVREDNYLSIEKSYLSCSAELGWPGPGQKSIMKLRDDCLQFNTYLQKFGHVIGLVLEHNLPNRNEYIKILWGNVQADFDEALKQYNPIGLISYDNEYDLSSIMHHPINKFTIEHGVLTMMVPDRWMVTHIGNQYRRMLSFGDVKMVNQLYRCGKACGGKVSCPRGGYVNEHCGCYTAAEYYRIYCMNNAAFEAECYKLAINGQCNPKNEKQHKFCSKACGFCPRFLPGQKVQPVPLDVCRDVYHEPMRCVAWAQAGLCEKSIFLKRYCAKSCNVCGHYLSKCPNLVMDLECDKAAKKGLCRSKQPAGDFARALCQSSCQSCMYVKRGNCKNNADEASCEERRKRGLCDLQPLPMFKECPASCNRCWFNAGDCANQGPDVKCEQMAALNRCTAEKYRRDMRQVCKKTCNTCVISPFAQY